MKNKEAVHLDAMYAAIASYESDEDDIYGTSHVLLFDVMSNYSYIGKNNYSKNFKHKSTIQGARPTIIETTDIICNGILYQSSAYIDLTLKNCRTRYTQSSEDQPNSVIQGRFYIINDDYDATIGRIDFEGTNSFKNELEDNFIVTTRWTRNSVFFC